MNKDFLRGIRPLLLVFVFLTAIFIAAKNFLDRNMIDQDVLIAGNLLLFFVSLVAFILTDRSFKNPNPNVFVRAMYGSFIIKFFVVAISAFVYIMIAKKEVNKPALMICAALYIVYTGMETRMLIKKLRQRTHA